MIPFHSIFPELAQREVRCLHMGFHVENHRKWSASEEALLGTDSDAVIAKELERTVLSVATKRRQKGIPAKTKVRPWMRQEIAMLGTTSDCEVARKLKRTVTAVSIKRLKCKIPPGRNRRWTRSEDTLLGTMRDEEVARNLGRAASAVRRRRTKLHIPVFQPKG